MQLPYQISLYSLSVLAILLQLCQFALVIKKTMHHLVVYRSTAFAILTHTIAWVESLLNSKLSMAPSTHR